MFRWPIDDETELRLFETRDAEALFALVDSCRAYLREWLPWVDGTKSPEDSRRFIEAARRQFADEDGCSPGIWHQGRLVGGIGFHHIDRLNRSTSIGYWLAEGHQGRGLVTKACRALVDYALLDLGL